jgi:cytoskeletal protein RodZ
MRREQFSPSPSVATSPDVDFGAPKKRTPLIIGAIFLILAIGAGAFFAMRAKNQEPSLPNTTAPAREPAQEQSAPPSTTDSPGTTPAAEKQPENSGGPASNTSTPIGEAPTPKSGDFADMFAKGAKNADGSPASKFDPQIAKTALNDAAGDVKNCRERGGPSGRANVSITFEPNGKVSSATISDGPFVGTSTGTCISNVFKRVKIPPFSGLPGSISKVIYIQ